MLLGRVVGTLVASRKEERLEGLKLLVVRQMDVDASDTSSYVVLFAFVAVFGLLGGLAAELLLNRDGETGAFELPRRSAGFIDIGASRRWSSGWSRRWPSCSCSLPHRSR